MIKKIKDVTVTLFLVAILSVGAYVGYQKMDTSPRIIDYAKIDISVIDKLTKVNYLSVGDEHFYPIKTYADMLLTTINLRAKYAENKVVDLLIDSGGGSTGALFYMHGIIQAIKKKHGVKIKCYINKAMSSAFTFAISVCDQRVLLKGGQMMQHKAYYYLQQAYAKLYTIDSKITSLKMAELECRYLGCDKIKWYRISRDNGDKYFTESEMFEYGLIDEVLE